MKNSIVFIFAAILLTSGASFADQGKQAEGIISPLRWSVPVGGGTAIADQDKQAEGIISPLRWSVPVGGGTAIADQDKQAKGIISPLLWSVPISDRGVGVEISNDWDRVGAPYQNADRTWNKSDAEFGLISKDGFGTHGITSEDMDTAISNRGMDTSIVKHITMNKKPIGDNSDGGCMINDGGCMGVGGLSVRSPAPEEMGSLLNTKYDDMGMVSDDANDYNTISTEAQSVLNLRKEMAIIYNDLWGYEKEEVIGNVLSDVVAAGVTGGVIYYAWNAIFSTATLEAAVTGGLRMVGATVGAVAYSGSASAAGESAEYYLTADGIEKVLNDEDTAKFAFTAHPELIEFYAGLNVTLNNFEEN